MLFLDGALSYSFPILLLAGRHIGIELNRYAVFVCVQAAGAPNS